MAKAANVNINWSRECGMRVKEKRMERGLSQGQLCASAKIRIKHLAGYENGSSSPKLNTLNAVCRALGTDVNYILRGEVVEQVAKPTAKPELKDQNTAAPAFPGNTVGERLRSARKSFGMTAREIAEIGDLGVGQYTLFDYEKGKILISEEKLRKLAELYSCRLQDLATDKELEEIKAHDRDPVVTKARMRTKAAAATKTSKSHAKPEIKTTNAVSASTVQTEPEPDVKTAVTQEPQLTENAANLAFLVKTERRKLGVTVKCLANALGMTQEEYMEFEAGRREISFSQLFPLGKALMLNPTNMVRNVSSEEWFMFRSDRSPKELYAALGVCLEHHIEYDDKIVEKGELHLFGNKEHIKKLFENLNIDGVII